MATDSTISARFDWSTTTPVSAVVRLCSVARDCEPTALAPLSETVDADALNTLLQSTETEFSIQFRYAGLLVRLRSDGLVTVQRGD